MPKISNTSESHLVLPDGPTVPAGGNRLISDDEWAKKESNMVVKAWVASGALVIDGGSDEDEGSTDDGQGFVPNANDGGTGEPVKLTEAELGEMTNEALKEFIESKGGIVKSTWNKAELIAQAVEVQK